MHVLQGTFRKDRHADHVTPEPPSGRPQPPKALRPEERREWDRMIARLEQSKVLSVVDDAVLYQYVMLFFETDGIRTEQAELSKLSAELKKAVRKLDGSDLVAAVGEIVKLQQIMAKQRTQLRQGHMAIRQYLVEFGLTPAARTRVKLSPKDEKPASRLDRWTKRSPA